MSRATGIKAARKDRVDLGLELAMMHAKPGVPMTQEALAEFLGVTKQAVSLMERSALRKMRHSSRLSQLSEALQ